MKVFGQMPILPRIAPSCVSAGDSRTPHSSIIATYRNSPARLKAEVADLQQHETPRKEPGQAKKEIQTGNLKGAATTAAAHIAESAASLFGSGKEDTGTQE